MLNFLDNSIHIFTVLSIAEVLARVCAATHEYIYYKNNYLPEKIDILHHTFSTTVRTKLLCLVLLFGTLLRFGLTRELIPPLIYFGYMPLYWIWTRGACVTHSTLVYSHFVREHTGLDYGEGMASNYFHGYLKFILPSETHSDDGIKSRIEQFEAEHNINFATKKLVILIPTSLYVSPTIDSKYLEKTHELKSVLKNRAGVLRNYKNDVYKMTRPIDGKFYYIALEGATPLLSFFDSMHFKLTRTWQMEQLQREILLKFYKSLKRMISDWPETQNTVELFFYHTKLQTGQPHDVGKQLFKHFKSKIKKTNGMTAIEVKNL